MNWFGANWFAPNWSQNRWFSGRRDDADPLAHAPYDDDDDLQALRARNRVRRNNQAAVAIVMSLIASGVIR